MNKHTFFCCGRDISDDMFLVSQGKSFYHIINKNKTKWCMYHHHIIVIWGHIANDSDMNVFKRQYKTYADAKKPLDPHQ